MNRLLFQIKRIIPRKFFLFVQPAYHFVLALAAAIYCGFPSRNLIVIGVTGTKGKTTVVELLHEILESAGHKTASCSSLRFRVGDEEEKNERKMTMPGRFFVQKFLRTAFRKKCQYAILEVTSEGIKQFRHRFIAFRAGVMTNVAPEHLESHGGFEKYLAAKMDLFWRLKKDGTAVINKDDPAAPRFGAATRASHVWYGKDCIQINERKFPVADAGFDSGISFDLDGMDISSPLLGEFNLYNILAAVSTALALHINREAIKEAISRVGTIPGRMEFVQKEPFSVMVDYAHTPDSLAAVYKFLRNRAGLGNGNETGQKNKLICVLGAAGGGRDKWKRQEFGRIAAQYCDEIFLTNEDPYDENPRQILSDISAGIPRGTKHDIILNRRESVREALCRAGAGDTVIITGKGAEPWIAGPGGEKIPWDDREVAREELRKINFNA